MTTAADYPGPLPATVFVLDGEYRTECHIDEAERGTCAPGLVTDPAPIPAGAGLELSPNPR